VAKKKKPAAAIYKTTLRPHHNFAALHNKPTFDLISFHFNHGKRQGPKLSTTMPRC
jgi:hypothetical protein